MKDISDMTASFLPLAAIYLAKNRCQLSCTGAPSREQPWSLPPSIPCRFSPDHCAFRVAACT